MFPSRCLASNLIGIRREQSQETKHPSTPRQSWNSKPRFGIIPKVNQVTTTWLLRNHPAPPRHQRQLEETERATLTVRIKGSVRKWERTKKAHTEPFTQEVCELPVPNFASSLVSYEKTFLRDRLCDPRFGVHWRQNRLIERRLWTFWRLIFIDFCKIVCDFRILSSNLQDHLDTETAWTANTCSWL